MAKSVHCFAWSFFLFISSVLFIFPKIIYAQSVTCSNPDACTVKEKWFTYKEYNIDADGNPECIDERLHYDCSNPRDNTSDCFQDRTSCSEAQNICNGPYSPGKPRS